MIALRSRRAIDGDGDQQFAPCGTWIQDRSAFGRGGSAIAVVVFFVVIFFAVAFVLLFGLLPRLALVERRHRQPRPQSGGAESAHFRYILLMLNGTPRSLGNVATAVQSTGRNQRRAVMAQKIIEVVGTSKESFAKKWN